MLHQTKLTNILYPNKLETVNWSSEQVRIKNFLSIPFFGTPCEIYQFKSKFQVFTQKQRKSIFVLIYIETRI